MSAARHTFNRWTGWAPIVMSAMAIGLIIFAVTTGFERHAKDEGVTAHSWQLLVGLQVPLIMAFVVSADWRKPLGVFAMLGLQALCLAGALLPVAMTDLGR